MTWLAVLKLTHVGKDDYRVFRAQVLGELRVTTGRLIPYCLFWSRSWPKWV